MTFDIEPVITGDSGAATNTGATPGSTGATSTMHPGQGSTCQEACQQGGCLVKFLREIVYLRRGLKKFVIFKNKLQNSHMFSGYSVEEHSLCTF